MVSTAYLNARKKWARPQAIIFSNNLSLNQDGSFNIQGLEGEDFIILSDHNRSPINISPDRIENRKRMVNAHMRSYHIADKLRLSTSWTDLPSRAFNKNPGFDMNEENESYGSPTSSNLVDYTVDGGAGGADLLRWYENTPGSFHVLLSYDNDASLTSSSFNNLELYTENLEMYFSSFDYNVKKRGTATFDLWDVNLSLEEV